MKKILHILLLCFFCNLSFAENHTQKQLAITQIPDFIPPQYGIPAKTLPDGICVFDIDNTLMASTKNWANIFPPFPNPSTDSNYQQITGYPDLALAPYVRDAIYQCITHHYGIAFNTAGAGPDAKDRIQLINTIFGDDRNSYPDYFSVDVARFLANAFLKGGKGIFQYYVTHPDKSAAMNTILSIYQKASPNIPIRSQCVILFDNDPEVINAIYRYNFNHKDTDHKAFLAILPAADKGVTRNVFNFGIETLINHNCIWNSTQNGE